MIRQKFYLLILDRGLHFGTIQNGIEDADWDRGSNKIPILPIELNYDFNKDNMKTKKKSQNSLNFFFNSSYIKVGFTFKSHTCDLYLCDRDRERDVMNHVY